MLKPYRQNFLETSFFLQLRRRKNIFCFSPWNYTLSAVLQFTHSHYSKCDRLLMIVVEFHDVNVLKLIFYFKRIFFHFCWQQKRNPLKVFVPFKGPNSFFDIRNSNFKNYLHRYFFYENRKNFVHFESFPVFTPDSFLTDVSITIVMSLIKICWVLESFMTSLKTWNFSRKLLFFPQKIFNCLQDSKKVNKKVSS